MYGYQNLRLTFQVLQNPFQVKLGDKEILKHIDLEIHPGETHILFGPNGSGKTSLLMTLMGYPQYKVTGGRILFKGEDITDMGTYWQIIRPGGVLYGEGRVLMMTKDGGIADWTGFGVGRPTGPSRAAHYACCGSFQTVPEKLARLDGIAAVTEFDVAEDGSYHWKSWEWK